MPSSSSVRAANISSISATWLIIRCAKGSLSLGCRINFAEEGGKLRVSSVDYGDETASPGEGKWDYFERIALCALATHLTVWRHGMQYHVAGVAPVAVITHNMPPNHPIRRLLAPHISETLSTNYYTHLTLRRNGFDVTGFSFPRDVIFKYYDDGARALDISMLDVRRERTRRGIPDTLDYPYYKQALRYYELFESYVGDYVDLYYPDQAAIDRDDELRQWFESLDKHIVNGIRGYVPTLTKENLTRLCALYIYAVTVEHEENTLWDYAVFLPTTVHSDGTGQTVGEVQLVLNFQYVVSSATNRADERLDAPCAGRARGRDNASSPDTVERAASRDGIRPPSLLASLSKKPGIQRLGLNRRSLNCLARHTFNHPARLIISVFL